jgi:hypothetical protein
MLPYPPRPEDHSNLYVLALKHFPKGLLVISIGITFLSSPLIYNFFRVIGIDSLSMRIILTASAVGIIPIMLLYSITLVRVPKIRRNMKLNALHTFEASSWDQAEEAIAELEEEMQRKANVVIQVEKIEINIYENKEVS